MFSLLHGLDAAFRSCEIKLRILVIGSKLETRFLYIQSHIYIKQITAKIVLCTDFHSLTGKLWKTSSTRERRERVSFPKFCDEWINIPAVRRTFYEAIYRTLYNNPSFSRILIGSRLWSIRGQMHDWRHRYTVFPSAVLKWRRISWEIR